MATWSPRYVNAKTDIHSYQDTEVFLGAEPSRRLAHNTWVVRRGAGIAIRLYATDILTYYPDGTFKANTGGYSTLTTMRRMNQFGPRGWWFYRKDHALRARFHHGEERMVEGAPFRESVLG
jgi:hypothetical protein